jgi:hypothetical protein
MVSRRLETSSRCCCFVIIVTSWLSSCIGYARVHTLFFSAHIMARWFTDAQEDFLRLFLPNHAQYTAGQWAAAVSNAFTVAFPCPTNVGGGWTALDQQGANQASQRALHVCDYRANTSRGFSTGTSTTGYDELHSNAAPESSPAGAHFPFFPVVSGAHERYSIQCEQYGVRNACPLPHVHILPVSIQYCG